MIYDDTIYDIWYGVIWYNMIYDVMWHMIYDMIYDTIYDMVWYDTIWYDIYLLQLCFHLVAVVGKLTQKQESSATVKERVKLYHDIPSGPLWPVLGQTVLSFNHKCADASGRTV